MARGITVVLIGLILVIFIGEGFNPLRLKGVEWIQMGFFWATCIGMVAAWRWPVVSGALSLAGMICFFAVESAVTGGLPHGPVFYLMLVPGILYLLSGFLRWRMSAA
jgi:hypothetical protein